MSETTRKPSTSVERLTAFTGPDLEDLCQATEDSIKEGGGFGWLKPPPRHVMEAFWKGVLLIPERVLFVGRLDGVVAGSAQLSRMPRNNEAQSFAAHLSSAFVAPWARGWGLARSLVRTVETQAQECGIEVLNVDLRETQVAAIQLYEELGYERWGTHPCYARVGGRIVNGRYYFKHLGAKR